MQKEGRYITTLTVSAELNPKINPQPLKTKSYTPHPKSQIILVPKLDAQSRKVHLPDQSMHTPTKQ